MPSHTARKRARDRLVLQLNPAERLQSRCMAKLEFCEVRNGAVSTAPESDCAAHAERPPRPAQVRGPAVTAAYQLSATAPPILPL